MTVLQGPDIPWLLLGGKGTSSHCSRSQFLSERTQVLLERPSCRSQAQMLRFPAGSRCVGRFTHSRQVLLWLIKHRRLRPLWVSRLASVSLPCESPRTQGRERGERSLGVSLQRDGLSSWGCSPGRAARQRQLGPQRSQPCEGSTPRRAEGSPHVRVGADLGEMA